MLSEVFNARSGDAVDLKCPIESYDSANKAVWMNDGHVLSINAAAYTIMVRVQ
jgi:hypothetical protein